MNTLHPGFFVTFGHCSDLIIVRCITYYKDAIDFVQLFLADAQRLDTASSDGKITGAIAFCCY
ncbi:protein of unknown function [Methylocaldum szegediense]|jgi:hypothetical protein|uniref:Uncharacterized protein n=1 Tax=Methylocaldum szegediense TaxID=73780 RepID=A0ABM9I4L7_9GAMM|nr:protein of unknown function [Methylocaldum szegediense]